MKFRLRDLLWLMTCVTLAVAFWMQMQAAKRIAGELERREERHGVEITNAIVARDKFWWSLLDDDCQEKVAAAWNYGMPGN